ncbi:phage terminase large subunit [Streptosporangium sp. NPDC049078]|uniref:phage terminase large subunit n=1 Tax=Streptosporangium sp. NPDC049078 TaxID=3155767 RepID=UPI0034373332
MTVTAPSPWKIAAAQFQPRTRRWATPGDLAQALDPTTVQTPALDLIDRELVAVADGEVDRLMVFMSPQEGKSVRVSHRFAEWMLVNNPDTRIAIVSYADEIARRWGSDIKLDTQTYDGSDDTIDLGLRLRADSRAAGRWQIEGHRGGVYCCGVAGSLTGRAVDLLLVDDPLKDLEQAQSAAYRERAWRFWQAVAVPRLGPGSRVVIIQTRWHDADLGGRLLAQDPGRWRVVSIPAVAESPDDPLGRQIGEPMISARGERDWAAIRRDVGEYVWAALYQQRPQPADGGLFKRAGLRHWVSGGEQRLRLGDRIVDLRDCWKFLTVDLAASVKTSADYTAAAVWAIGPAGDLVMLDGIRERLDPAGHWPAVRGLRERWSADVVFVESRMFGTTLVYEAAQAGVPVQELHADADKITRALPATARADSGRLWLPSQDRMPEVADWRDELLAFPNGTHDDCVDVVAYAARVAGAHWLPAESAPLPGRGGSDDGVIGQAYAAATGGSAGVDFMSVNY